MAGSHCHRPPLPAIVKNSSRHESDRPDKRSREEAREGRARAATRDHDATMSADQCVNALKMWRKEKARALERPAFCVFSDKVLNAIVEAAPQSESDLLAIKGVGRKMVTDFGADVLTITRRMAGGAKARNTPTWALGARTGIAPIQLASPRSGTDSIQVANPPSGTGSIQLAFQRAPSGLPPGWRAVSSRSHPGKQYYVHDVTGERQWQRPTAVGGGTAGPPPPRRVAPNPASTSTASLAALTPAEAQANYAKMNARQRRVLDVVLDEGQNCHVYGPAGTGKSFAIATLIAMLHKKHGRDAVAVTAPTGIAAVAVGGTTIHRFIGAGLCKGPVDQVVRIVLRSPKAVKRWKETKVLIVDEVSMLDADLLMKVEACGRAARGAPSAPFGGLQLVVTGDFNQLPPVSRSGGPGESTPPFAFLAQAWKDAEFVSVRLTEVVRQRERALVDALNDIRDGRCGPATEALLRSLNRPLPKDASGVLPTRLYCTNRSVDEENLAELNRLSGETVITKAVDFGSGKALEALQRNVRAPSELRTKVGAQVVLLTAVDDALVNGSRGVVVGYEALATAHRFRVNAKFQGREAEAFARVPVVR